MKRFSIIALVLVLAISLAACGRRNNNETSAPSTDVTILPDINPTIDTNIPDPDVNTSMPMYTDGTNSTDGFGNTDGSNGSGNAENGGSAAGGMQGNSN